MSRSSGPRSATSSNDRSTEAPLNGSKISDRSRAIGKTETTTAAQQRPRKRRNRDAAVIEAAVSVMSEKGYAATSIQEVADRVGVLKGSLYYYFSSKEELLARILDTSHGQSVIIAEEAAQLGLSPLEELLSYLERQATWYLEHIDLANIYFSEMGQLSGERLKNTEERARDFSRHIRELVVAAQDEGQIPSVRDPRLITRFIIGSLNHMRSWPRTSSGTKFGNRTMVEAYVAMTKGALLAP